MVMLAVDIIIAVVEVLLIASPLAKVVAGNTYLEKMDLDAVENCVKAVYGPVMVSEVARVADALLAAVKSLRESKAFLPNTVISDEDSETLPETTTSSRKSGEPTVLC
eukprot:TRINITY_DN49105_c0_g1_i1.p1 TRINITY_DN49105_c0_g1~~TRINITY_DN49105_c0_g1_i1.p1  ORF type:complete len:108 (+),score=37.23 TRINITY_DN49105_c0_g1_i1:94-417(+)